MAKKFSDLRSKLSASAREKAEQHTLRMLADIDVQREGGVEVGQLSNSYDDYTKDRVDLFKNETVKSLVAEIKARRAS
jgi:hypothetical protein